MRQLLDAFIEGAKIESLVRLSNETAEFDFERPDWFLSQKLDKSSTYYIILDGLHDCDEDELRLAMNAFSNMYEGFFTRAKWKFFVSGRTDIEKTISACMRPTHCIAGVRQDVEQDISRFIEVTLDSKLQSEELVLGDPSLILKIQDFLVQGSQGMFLWAFYLIEDICAQTSDAAILLTLEHIPEKLTDLFDRILRRLNAHPNISVVLSIFKWVPSAQRPLKLDELREALTVAPGQTSLQINNMSNNIVQDIATCKGLVYLDYDDLTVHVMHHSVAEHLLSFGSDPVDSSLNKFHFNLVDLDDDTALLALTYLNFTDFSRQLVKADTIPVTVDPVKVTAETLRGDRSITARIARSLLSSHASNRPVLVPDLKDMMRKAGALSKRNKYTERAFLQYARMYWVVHSRNIQPETHEATWLLLRRSLETAALNLHRP